jgi:hypothetical protein
MRDVNVGFCNSVLPICMRRSCVWLLIIECIHEYSETKYEGKDQWLCFVPEAQTLQRCLDPYSRSGCCLILHPLFFDDNSSYPYGHRGRAQQNWANHSHYPNGGSVSFPPFYQPTHRPSFVVCACGCWFTLASLSPIFSWIHCVEFNLLMYSREALSLVSMINVDFLCAFFCNITRPLSHGIHTKKKKLVTS